MGQIGVYQIELNGKRYVGSSVNIEKRFKYHLYGLINKRHGNKHLQNAFNKYGLTAIHFHIIETAESPKGLIELEQKHIDLIKPEYNICKIAYSRFGEKHSEETKQKISQANTGRNRSEESKRKMGLSQRGRHHSEKTKREIREKVNAKEAIEKNRQAHLRINLSEETINKMRLAHTGRLHSEESKRKMGLPRIGTHHSEETKQKMSIAQKERYANIAGNPID